MKVPVGRCHPACFHALEVPFDLAMAGLRAPVRPLPGPEQRNVNYISSLLDMSTKDDLFSCSANFSGTTKVDCLEIRSNEVGPYHDCTQP